MPANQEQDGPDEPAEQERPQGELLHRRSDREQAVGMVDQQQTAFSRSAETKQVEHSRCDRRTPRRIAEHSLRTDSALDYRAEEHAEHSHDLNGRETCDTTNPRWAIGRASIMAARVAEARAQIR